MAGEYLSLLLVLWGERDQAADVPLLPVPSRAYIEIVLIEFMVVKFNIFSVCVTSTRLPSDASVSNWSLRGSLRNGCRSGLLGDVCPELAVPIRKVWMIAQRPFVCDEMDRGAQLPPLVKAYARA
ncbi:hypothetical protein IEO21_06272 [Rhodonia placenta]|uniref:Uncharacterized protein n=1 Tax=Rhodonia placenta TaxID=104341 RepID=A0A8H7P0C3_9APHY|nr:hypothetical protein IEO21_06272 [Postia placenta]